MRRIVILGLVFGCVVSMTSPALAGSAEKAAKAFAAGNALLADADFKGALKAYKKAAKAQRDNQEYAQQYAMLRQVIRMRKEIEKTQTGSVDVDGSRTSHVLPRSQNLLRVSSA